MQRQAWLEREAGVLPVSRQCELLGLARRTVYYRPVAPPALDEVLKRRLDGLYAAHPFYGQPHAGQVLGRETVPAAG